ncbi:unnamed protein product [Mytilus edulis]|uniref:G-protein coupled receptors family 1 profile domain-containing protein n=1 Tax=Mytilus edulis TaxID=6550 RepID=A0A8S3PTG2_MYTED|nr:unnamed protein product [Mytilus edulis]
MSLPPNNYEMGSYYVGSYNHTSMNDTKIPVMVRYNKTDDYYQGFMPPTPSQLLLDIMEFKRWAILFIIIFGVIGNVVSFYIFTKSKLRKVSTSRYFSAISIVDIGYLLSTLCTNLTTWGVSVYHVHGLCPLIMYVNHICTFLSIWYVTSLVIEKFIGLFWPSKKAHFCTVFRAKCVIIGLAILAVVCYHYVTWTVGSDYPYMYCFPWPENELFETWNKLNKVDAVVVSVIPYVLIFCLSCLIGVKTWQFYKRNRSTGFRLHRRQTAYVPQDKEYKTSGLLLLVAYVTFFLSITNGVFRVLMIMQPQEMILIAQLFQTISYSIKPILYILGSRPYRKEIWRALKQTFICERLFRSSSLSEMQTVSQQTDNGRAIEIVVEKTM